MEEERPLSTSGTIHVHKRESKALLQLTLIIGGTIGVTFLFPKGIAFPILFFASGWCLGYSWKKWL